MRMLLPQLALRREIDRNLVLFFRKHQLSAFNRAISRLCRFYHVRRPKIEWFASLDWGKTAGKTYENGKIHLLHPLHWKRGRIYNRERMWIQTVYHELGHYLLWTDPEYKADAFSRRMVRGLRRGTGRNAAGSIRQGRSFARPGMRAKSLKRESRIKIRRRNRQARA
jgi:hypothetical protein